MTCPGARRSAESQKTAIVPVTAPNGPKTAKVPGKGRFLTVYAFRLRTRQNITQSSPLPLTAPSRSHNGPTSTKSPRPSPDSSKQPMPANTSPECQRCAPTAPNSQDQPRMPEMRPDSSKHGLSTLNRTIPQLFASFGPFWSKSAQTGPILAKRCQHA